MFCNPFFDIASIIISAIIIYFYSTTKKTKSAQNRVFVVLNYVNAFTSAFDILSYYFTYTKESLFLCDLFVLFYFLTHILIIPLFFVYILMNIKNWFDYSIIFKIIAPIPLIVMLIMACSNPWTHIIYWYTEDFTYVRAPGMIVLYLGIAFYISTIMFIMLRNKKLFPIVKMKTISYTLIFIFASVIIQFISEQTRIETFGISFGLLLIFLTIQDPHDELDYDTGLYNKNAFEEVINQALHTSKGSTLISVFVKDFVELFKISENKSMLKQITTFLKEIDPSIEVFIYSNNIFCLYINRIDDTKNESIIEIIQNRFNKPWIRDDIAVKYNVKICTLKLPTDVDKLSKINSMFNNLAERKDSKTVLTIEDFDYRKLERSLLLTSAINRAIEKDLFELIFTPVFSIKDNRIKNVSISFRFLDDNIGYVEASEIIPVLERQGILFEVLQNINFKILDFFMSDSFKELHLNGVSIKITSVMTIQSGALENLCRLFEKYHADTSMIYFEISEMIVYKTEHTLNTLMPRLQNKGFTFILCEYGSGYSNIAAIYNLPFKNISIDGNVVRAAYESKNSRIILRKTLELAKKLDMQLILTGIIDPKYFEMLKYFPCDYACGSYFLENLDLTTFKETLKGGSL